MVTFLLSKNISASCVLLETQVNQPLHGIHGISKLWALDLQEHVKPVSEISLLLLLLNFFNWFIHAGTAKFYSNCCYR